MPDASVVIARLLDFIDRVDTASQHGLSRPAFETADGHPIFPVDEVWWLTGVQRKQEPEQDPGQGDEEDGPPSEYDPGEDLHVSDDDPLSEVSFHVGQFEANVAWDRRV